MDQNTIENLVSVYVFFAGFERKNLECITLTMLACMPIDTILGQPVLSGAADWLAADSLLVSHDCFPKLKSIVVHVEIASNNTFSMFSQPFVQMLVWAVFGTQEWTQSECEGQDRAGTAICNNVHGQLLPLCRSLELVETRWDVGRGLDAL